MFWILGNTMGKNRKLDFICNTIGSLIYALNSVILLMAVVRILGSDQGGVFSIAYTISQTVLVIGNFEMRVFQSIKNCIVVVSTLYF